MIWKVLGKDGQRWVKGTIVMIVGFCILALILFRHLEWDKLGGVGGFYGGLSAPLIGILTIMLLYAAFKMQAQATRIQYLAMKDERAARKRDERGRAIEDGILRLERILERACYVRIDHGGTRNPYRGIDGIYRFCVDSRGNGSGPYATNEIMLDILRHWLFDAAVILRNAWESDRTIFDELCHRVQSLYSFTLVKSLNTLSDVSNGDGTFMADLEQLWKVKAMFDRALEGQFDSEKSA